MFQFALVMVTWRRVRLKYLQFWHRPCNGFFSQMVIRDGMYVAQRTFLQACQPDSFFMDTACTACIRHILYRLNPAVNKQPLTAWQIQLQNCYRQKPRLPSSLFFFKPRRNLCESQCNFHLSCRVQRVSHNTMLHLPWPTQNINSLELPARRNSCLRQSEHSCRQRYPIMHTIPPHPSLFISPPAPRTHSTNTSNLQFSGQFWIILSATCANSFPTDYLC